MSCIAFTKALEGKLNAKLIINSKCYTTNVLLYRRIAIWN